MFEVTTKFKPKDSTHCGGCQFFQEATGEGEDYDSYCGYFSRGLEVLLTDRVFV